LRYFVWKITILRQKILFFFHLRREARKFLGHFVWKITILRQKIIFFSNLGPPPWIRPCIITRIYIVGS
jgi:hypothetical protein